MVVFLVVVKAMTRSTERAMALMVVGWSAGEGLGVNVRVWWLAWKKEALRLHNRHQRLGIAGPTPARRPRRMDP